MLSLNIKRIPTTSGIYFFRDKRGRILYIGKASNLRNRIKSYFASKQTNPRITKLLDSATSIDRQETDSEIEALILESQLIKKHKPPFNIMFRDDKQYFFVVFSNDEFSKVIITHRPTSFSRPKFLISNFQFLNKFQTQNPKFKNLTPKTYNLKPGFIGPFTDGGALKIALRLLRRIFPYCTCKQKHNNYCLNHHISRCLGFCCLKKVNSLQFTVYRKEYKKNIKAIKEILKGKRNSLIKKLKKEMLELGKKHEFEKAIELRDKIEKLEKVFTNAKIIARYAYFDKSKYQSKNRNQILAQIKKTLQLPISPHRIEGYDISNIQGKFATGAMVVFVDGQPDKSQYRKFKIKFGDGSNDVAMLREVLTRRFNHTEWPYPDLIIVDGGKAQLNAARLAISNFKFLISNKIRNPKSQISIIALAKDARHRGEHIFLDNKKMSISLKSLPASARNLILQIDAEAHRFAISYYRKLHGQLN